MTDKVFSIVFILTIGVLTLLEKKRLGSIITPFTVTAWPFVGIVGLNNFLLVQLKFHPVTARSQLFILSNLFVMWIVGYFMYHVYKINLRTESPRPFELFSYLSNYQFIIIILSWIAIVVTYFKVNDLIQSHGGYGYFTEQEFENSMAHGIGAHFTHLAEICFIFLVFSLRLVKYKVYSIVTLIGLFCAIAIVQVKYHLIWAILIVFFYYNLSRRSKIQFKKVLLVVFIVLLIMNMFWIFMLIIWGTLGTSAGWDLLIAHTFDYFVSGPIVLDTWLNLGNSRPEWTLLTVPLNFINTIMGNPIRINPTPLVSGAFTEVAPGVVSNIGTSYGVYYLVGGFSFTIFMTMVVSIISYYFYYKSIFTKNTIIIFVNYLLMTLNTLSFFGQYFTALSVYEIIVLYVIFMFLFNISSLFRRMIKSCI